MRVERIEVFKLFGGTAILSKQVVRDLFRPPAAGGRRAARSVAAWWLCASQRAGARANGEIRRA